MVCMKLERCRYMKLDRCVYVCVYVCMLARMSVCMYIHMYVCMRVCIHYIDTHEYLGGYMFLRVLGLVGLYTYIHAYIMCTYIHTYIHSVCTTYILCINTYIYIETHEYLGGYMFLCALGLVGLIPMYMCMYACMYVH